MDLVKEILRLPNYYYEYVGNDGRIHMVVLGGHSCKLSDTIENWRVCSEYLHRMESIYEKGELSDDEKRNLAINMHRIQGLCESRKVGLYSLDEQAKYLNSLQSEEIEQIEIQVKMYKDARQYYNYFIYKRR